MVDLERSIIMIEDAIKTAFRKKTQVEKLNKDGQWNYPMYWAIDLHDVIIPGTYTRNNEDREFFRGAKGVLKWLSDREDMTLILYTSSYEDSVKDILGWMEENGIKFDYFNENPECESNDLCNFHSKFYFDVMLEDKAGFMAEQDWVMVQSALITLREWDKKTSHSDTIYYEGQTPLS